MSIESESVAVAGLKRLSWLVLSRNRRIAGVEIDIVARVSRRVYSFVEVKQMSERHYSAGYPPVSQAQMKRYQKAMLEFCSMTGGRSSVFMTVIVTDGIKVIDFISPYSIL